MEVTKTNLVMGNTHGGGSEPWRRETVESSYYATRPLNSSSSDSSSCGTVHAGVVVHTKEGNDFLIHHPGGDKLTTVTQASNMSKAWEKSHDIPVSGVKTVQDVYNGAGGRTNNQFDVPIVGKVTLPVNYITGGTCVGVAKNAEKTLKK